MLAYFEQSLKYLIFCFDPQEAEKVIGLQSQLEQEQTKKSTLLSELSLQSSEVAHLKSKEMQLVKEVTQLREVKRRFEDEVIKIKNAHNVDILQVKIYSSIYPHKEIGFFFKENCSETALERCRAFVEQKWSL